MAKDSELQKCRVNIPVLNRRGYTQFTIVPPPAIEKIGTTTNGSDILTVNNNTGVLINHYIYGSGIPTGTFVESISGQEITMSNNATTSVSLQNIIFYETAEDGLLPLKSGQTIKFL